MSYVEWAPPASLSTAVACLWRSTAPERPSAMPILPDGCVDLIWQSERGAFLAGPDTGPVANGGPGGRYIVGVRLRPGAGGTVLGMPLTELRNLRPDLSELGLTERADRIRGGLRSEGRGKGPGGTGGEGRSNGLVKGPGDGLSGGGSSGVVEGLGDGLSDGRSSGLVKGLSAGWGNGLGEGRRNGPIKGRGNGLSGDLAGDLDPTEALRRLVTLTGHLVEAHPIDPAMLAAARLLHAPDSRVQDLGDTLGISERQLRRRFSAAVGYGPKTLHRVFRFRRFLRMAGEAPLAELAVRAGYTDQAHLTRETAEFAGMSPAALVRLRKPHAQPPG